MPKTKTKPAIGVSGDELGKALKAVGTATSNSDDGGAVVRIAGSKGDKHVWVSAANPKLSVEYKMPTENPLFQDFKVTTTYPLLNTLSRHIKQAVILEVEGSTVVARGESLRVVLPTFTIPVTAMRDPEEPLEPLFSAPYSDTDSWFKRAAWAADERSERSTFVGPHILKDGDRCAVVASDTRVMVVYFVDGATMHSDDIQLPTHFLSALSRVGAGAKEIVTVNTNANNTKVIVQVSDRVVMTAPLIQSTFPNLWKTYAHVTDESIYTNYTVSSAELTEVMQRVTDLANAQQHSKNIYIRMKFSGGLCDIAVYGSANEIFTGFFYSKDEDTEGDPLTINIDPSLVLPFLKRCDSDAVVLAVPNLTSANHPVLLTDGVYDTADYRCIIAPVRGQS